MATVNHLALFCRDLSAQEAFYTKHFGMQRSRTFHPGTEQEFFMLKLGSVRLELFSSKVPEGNGGPQAVGFFHLAFDVDDLDASVAALQADGIETEDIIDCGEVSPGMRICFFHDPEGNRLELMENYADEEA